MGAICSARPRQAIAIIAWVAGRIARSCRQIDGHATQFSQQIVAQYRGVRLDAPRLQHGDGGGVEVGAASSTFSNVRDCRYGYS